ncbi:MAG: DUF2341 domain-containing protein [Fibrobacteria bacterium]|nr:DUF2341 domain-containing protein [Fibrobacteria bacterium]
MKNRLIQVIVAGLLLVFVAGCGDREDLSGGTVETTDDISGVILQEDGKPAAYTEVVIRSAYFTSAEVNLLKKSLLNNFMDKDTTDKNGAFSFVVEDTGSFIIQAYVNDSSAVQLSVQKKDTLPVDLGESRAVLTGSLSGSLDYSGEAGVSALVQILGTNRSLVLENGMINYTFSGLPEGVYTLSVTRINPPGNPVLSEKITVLSGQATADIILDAGMPLFGGIRGTVKFPSGQSGDFVLDIIGDSTAILIDSITGTFDISTLDSGIYRLRAWGVRPFRDTVQQEISVNWNSYAEDVELFLGNPLAKITINTTVSGANIPETVYNFPLMIRLDANQSTSLSLKADGSNIRFLKSDKTTPLRYEIGRWDAGGGQEIWINIDTILGNSNSQYIYLMGVDDSLASQSAGEAVFDTANGFSGVWHLDETANSQSTGYRDATQNGNHGSGVNMTQYVGEGTFFDKAQQFDGSSSYIQIPHHATLNVGTGDFTLSALIKADDIPYSKQIVCKHPHRQETLESGNYELQILRDSLLVGHMSDSTQLTALTSASPIKIGQWYHVAMQRNNGLARLFIDGRLVGIGQQAEVDVNSEGDFFIGTDPAYTNEYFQGVIDEVRVSRVARSASWIALSANNLKAGSNLIILEE